MSKPVELTLRRRTTQGSLLLKLGGPAITMGELKDVVSGTRTQSLPTMISPVSIFTSVVGSSALAVMVTLAAPFSPLSSVT